MTHDYKRNGTTLCSLLDLLQGKVIGDFHKRHRHQEFLKFLRRIDREFPAVRLCTSSWTTTDSRDSRGQNLLGSIPAS